MIKFFRKIVLGVKLVFYKRSYLNRTGYVNSKVTSTLKTAEGKYVPWMNYSVIKLLEDRLTNDIVVFEYGSGASTMFWAEHCAEVTSIEYDKKWFDIIKEHLKEVKNASLHPIEVGPDYISAIKTIGSGKQFDLVVVDGRERVECAKFAKDFLSDRGVLIMDDTGRKHYHEAFDYFSKDGYNILTLEGLKPTGFGLDQTTFFYKSGNNILGL